MKDEGWVTNDEWRMMGVNPDRDSIAQPRVSEAPPWEKA